MENNVKNTLEMAKNICYNYKHNIFTGGKKEHL